MSLRCDADVVVVNDVDDDDCDVDECDVDDCDVDYDVVVVVVAMIAIRWYVVALRW